MKRQSFFTMAIMLACMAACSDDDPISYEQLPAQSKNMIETYFGGVAVTSVSQEPNDDNTYEVKLSNGVEIGFDANGDWREIEGNGQPLPQDIQDLLLPGIATYKAANYPGFSIIKIERESDKLEIVLNDGTELHFAPDGSFIREDKKGTGIPDNIYNQGSYESLPQAAKDFLATHYAGIGVARVYYEKYDDSPHEVRLADGAELEFDANGNWREIKRGNNGFPASVTALLPANIVSYVTANYPGKAMVKIEKESDKYEVEITGGIKLRFKANGEFVKVDD